ncbi:hypothetical protein [Paenibacillus thalictri]|uniref:Uncharacterized protein n=1 Tax=Paenibacillus thalictri TaxID=2527873 RepID=A0A4Q9DSY0_9BACL|nr:hypothetical protein [Paenibacillus thalictri]TBL79346.1 hypothetical protein EYB31_10535 [Paenibacillus thalictri]
MSNITSALTAVWKLVRTESDTAAFHESVDWAIGHLTGVCSAKGIALLGEEAAPGGSAEFTLTFAGGDVNAVSDALEHAGLTLGETESFALIPERAEGPAGLLAAGADDRGLMYAILEIADIVKHADSPLDALRGISPLAQRPASPVRSINRLFVSEAEDKPWFYDPAFWSEYLTELATHRFNRFHLALGMGYDYGHDPGVHDNYFCFAYPYFLQVPGYEVCVKELPEGEAQRNLAALQLISEEARRRGIHFQLGIWTHAYDPSESPNAKYTIEGVHRQNHAEYCRDGLSALLEACPLIDGVTIRTHYEGGIPEPAHEFWAVVFSGIEQSGRKVELDLHSKGVDEQMLGVAVDTGLPVVVSPKYWAEHMGPPYHQAAIRPLELPVTDTERPDLMAITATYRRFTRYGYADFLREDRKHDVLYRIWPGTQRVLLWGDPEMAAGYGRLGTFCGALGVELCEPLTFKGRKGSGSPGGRDSYADGSLALNGADWKKYAYSYRLWGRLLYNPDADPSGWRRYLAAEFGAAAAPGCEAALAVASRILPLLTAAHLPSAANNHFWPEMYANLPIVNMGERSQYAFDTPAPATFGAVSPLDPALFYRIEDYADEVVRGAGLSGKYTPLEVAGQLEAWAETALAQLGEAAAALGEERELNAAWRRLAVDAAMLAELGRFFAEKLRAGVAYAIYERTSSESKLHEAVARYKAAKAAWQRLAATASGVYRDDITFGYVPYMRGHWADRLPDIEADIAAMERLLAGAPAEREAAAGIAADAGTEAASVQAGGTSAGSGAGARTASGANAFGVAAPAGSPASAYAGAAAGSSDAQPAHAARAQLQAQPLGHDAPAAYRRGEAIPLRVTAGESVAAVRLHYRLVHQAQPYKLADMAASGGGEFSAEIPADDTDSPYPVMYFFELVGTGGETWLSPGFNETFSNQPYYVVRQTAAGRI